MILPISYGNAKNFLEAHHRHAPWAPNARAHKFSLGLFQGVWLVGVVMVCRPANRHVEATGAWEVARLCTDGTRNACSRLYAAAWREARRRGCAVLGTYTLDTESGSSLRAAGWVPVRRLRARSWSTPSRTRRSRPLPAEYRVYWLAPAPPSP